MIETTVNWSNVTTGERGVVRVPTRAYQFTWHAVIRPGHGHVDLTVDLAVDQKVGVLVIVTMVEQQYSSCRGSVQA